MKDQCILNFLINIQTFKLYVYTACSRRGRMCFSYGILSLKSLCVTVCHVEKITVHLRLCLVDKLKFIIFSLYCFSRGIVSYGISSHSILSPTHDHTCKLTKVAPENSRSPISVTSSGFGHVFSSIITKCGVCSLQFMGRIE